MANQNQTSVLITFAVRNLKWSKFSVSLRTLPEIFIIFYSFFYLLAKGLDVACQLLQIFLCRKKSVLLFREFDQNIFIIYL